MTSMLTDGENKIEVNGVAHWMRIARAEHATIPLVIVHGGPGGHVYNFERTIGPQLEAFTTVIYYEQRGCGRSDQPLDPYTYSIDMLVSDLDELRQALGLERINLLGFAFGGELALEYALVYPEYVERLIVQSPSTGPLRRRAWLYMMSIRPACNCTRLSNGGLWRSGPRGARHHPHRRLASRAAGSSLAERRYRNRRSLFVPLSRRRHPQPPIVV